MKFLDVTRTTYRVSDFISWQRSDTLELSPSFQRRSVWRPIEKSYLIDTVLRGLPMPVIFLRDLPADLDKLEPVRQVVDGQQRIRTLLSYISPNLVPDFDEARDAFVVRPSHNSEITGLTFPELPKELRGRLLNYQFSVHVFPSDTDDREVLQIFARMNSTGVKLTAQELRNAEFIGEFKTLMYRLAAEQLDRWRDWTVFSEQEIARMEEVELVSEIAYMMINGLSGRSQKALNSLYKANEESVPAGSVVAKRFRVLMDSVDEKLGQKLPDLAFSRKTLIYPLLAGFYELLYGLESDLKPKKAQPVRPRQAQWIAQAGERISNGTAPEDLLELISRRTTHPSTRRAVFDYILQGS
jgi:hypothetical protein